MTLQNIHVALCRIASITLAVTSDGSTSTKAAESEPAEHLPEARFLDAMGVLVGQSGGMKNMKSSKSWSGPFRTAPSKLETTKIEVSESGDDP